MVLNALLGASPKVTVVFGVYSCIKPTTILNNLSRLGVSYILLLIMMYLYGWSSSVVATITLLLLSLPSLMR